jgi:alpha-amylase
LYFQVHQPHRLRHFSFFEAGKSNDYFDTKLNQEIISRVADRCYQPTSLSLLRAISKHKGRFNVSFSISGTAIEQMRRWKPEVLSVFQQLVETGCVELLAETYYHSLASLNEDSAEFHKQVSDHKALIESEFKVAPEIFRNTELIHSDIIAKRIREAGFKGAFVEGIPEMLRGGTVHAVYKASDSDLRLFPRDSELSDLLAFRLQNGGKGGGSLTPGEFVTELKRKASDHSVTFLALDFETFGEHHRSDVGACNFIERVADELLLDSSWHFVTPSQVIASYKPVSELSFPQARSWADQARDISPWQGNSMQIEALAKLYAAEFRSRCAPDLWGALQTSDHFYYMSTKGGADGDVHRYFSPFESPYDAFICYMNVLRGVGMDCLLPTSLHNPKKSCCGPENGAYG